MKVCINSVISMELNRNLFDYKPTKGYVGNFTLTLCYRKCT